MGADLSLWRCTLAEALGPLREVKARYASLDVEHVLAVVVFAPLLGIVFGRRRRAGEDIDDCSIGDVPPVPAGD